MDDLQFLLEEQGIISGDTLETATETNQQKLANLQQELSQEKEATKQLQEQLEVGSQWNCVYYMYMIV